MTLMLSSCQMSLCVVAFMGIFTGKVAKKSQLQLKISLTFETGLNFHFEVQVLGFKKNEGFEHERIRSSRYGLLYSPRAAKGAISMVPLTDEFYSAQKPEQLFNFCQLVC